MEPFDFVQFKERKPKKKGPGVVNKHSRSGLPGLARELENINPALPPVLVKGPIVIKDG